MRLFRRPPQTPILQPDSDTTSSTPFFNASIFLIRRIVLLLILALPVLYITHIILLAVYSRILTHPHLHQYEPFNVHPEYHDDHEQLRTPPQTNANTPPVSAHDHHPPPHPDRTSATTDTFSTYLHHDTCGISSLDLHVPRSPVCDTKQSTLDAMSWGGRAGFDQPYMPFGCDFQWYDTSEICTILSRFSHIYIIGDSLQRMIVTALYILLRKDIGLGGIGEWGFQPAVVKTEESMNKVEDCMCEHQFNRHECSHAPVNDYSEAIRLSFSDSNHPACGDGAFDRAFDLSFRELQKYPVTEMEMRGVIDALQEEKPEKPVAFVLHNTFWNDVNVTATTLWLDQLTEAITKHATYLPKPQVGTYYAPGTRRFPRLFVTANAAGVMKNSQYLSTQNSEAVARFESEIKQHLDFRGIEMLGFFNMSVQATSSDGTHANMRTNLLKAMMVVNWLDWVGREETETWESCEGGKEEGDGKCVIGWEGDGRVRFG